MQRTQPDHFELGSEDVRVGATYLLGLVVRRVVVLVVDALRPAPVRAFVDRDVVLLVDFEAVVRLVEAAPLVVLAELPERVFVDFALVVRAFEVVDFVDLAADAAPVRDFVDFVVEAEPARDLVVLAAEADPARAFVDFVAVEAAFVVFDALVVFAAEDPVRDLVDFVALDFVPEVDFLAVDRVVPDLAFVDFDAVDREALVFDRAALRVVVPPFFELDFVAISAGSSGDSVPWVPDRCQPLSPGTRSR